MDASRAPLARAEARPEDAADGQESEGASRQALGAHSAVGPRPARRQVRRNVCPAARWLEGRPAGRRGHGRMLTA